MFPAENRSSNAKSSCCLPSLQAREGAQSNASGSRLTDIQPTCAPAPKVKTTLQWFRENCSLGLTWFKIAANRILPTALFTLEEHKYENPLTLDRFDHSTCAALSHTLDLTLDFLRSVQEKQSSESIALSQRELIHEVCHGPASDIIFDLMNFVIQEAKTGAGLPALMERVPRHQGQQIQALVIGLQSSALFRRAHDFSLYFNRDQQKQALQKFNEFPCRQMAIGPRAVSKVLASLRSHHMLNTVTTQVIRGQGPNAQASARDKIAPIEPGMLAPQLKKMLELGAKLLDSYRRAEQEPNPFVAESMRNGAIQQLHSVVMEDPLFLPAFHTMIDSICDANTRLNTVWNAEEALEGSQLLKIAEALCPKIPQPILCSSLESMCKRAVTPLQILKTLTDRLSVEQEKTALFNVLHGHSEFSEGLMSILLDGFKQLALGRAPEQVYNEPKELAKEYDVKGGCELARDLLAGDGSPESLKSIMTARCHQPFLRNLLSQESFTDAMAHFSEKLPETLRENLEGFIQSYSLGSLGELGKHLMPHINEDEFRTVLTRIPDEIYATASFKMKTFVNYLGDPDNNLLMGLSRAKTLDEQSVLQLWDLLGKQYPGMVCANNGQFKEFLDLTNTYHDKRGRIPERRLTTLQYKRDQVLACLNENGKITSAHGFDQLNKLLAEMGIKQDFAQAPAVIQSPSQASEHRDNLIALRTAISRQRISGELYTTLSKLLPAMNDSGEALGDQVLNQQALGLDVRKRLMSEIFGAMAKGVDEPSQEARPVDKNSIDMLWSLTGQLITSTQRTVTLNVRDGQIVSDKDSQADHFIFMEDGSCVDATGRLLPEGDPENHAFREQYCVQEKLDALRPAVRAKLKNVLLENWQNLAQLLAKHPQREDFKNLLKEAHLPDDVAKLMVDLLEQLLPSNLRESGLGQYATRGFSAMSPELIGDLLSRIPDPLFDRFSGQVTRLVNELNPYEQMPFFQVFADQLVASLGENQSVQSVARVLTQGYYNEICHSDKRALAKAILALGCPDFVGDDITPDSMKAFVGAMTQSGGPGFQKAMQLFKSDIHIPEIREALADMDGDVAPESRDYVQRVIQEDLPKIKDKYGHQKYMLITPDQYSHLEYHGISREEIASSQLKPLGSATIAQTHQAYLWECENGQPKEGAAPVIAAMKVQRPHIAHRIFREMQALKRIPNISLSAEQTLEELKRSIIGETDFTREYQFGLMMAELYGNDQAGANVKVVDMLGCADRLLIQRFAPGNSLDKTWQTKSAEFGLYFGETNPEVEKHLELHKNRIQIVLENGLVTGINISHEQKVRPSQMEHQTAKVLKPKKTTLHVDHYPLEVGDPLQQKLQEVSARAQVPGYVQKHLLTKLIFSRVDNPLVAGDVGNTAVDLSKQADFLDVAGQRLQTLVGDFARAACVGVPPEQAYHTKIGSPSAVRPENRKRKVFFEQVVKQEAGFTRKLGQGPKQWRVSLFDRNGAPLAKVDLDFSIPQHRAVIDRIELAQRTRSKIEPEDLQEARYFNNSLRESLGQSILFEGESFIDSDRHDGNLLYNENTKELTCIDTGAGTIVSKGERYGMLKLATGMTSLRADLALQGLSELIPDLNTILDSDDESYRRAHNGRSKRDALVKDLEKSLKGYYEAEEKVQEIFQFLLINKLIDKSLMHGRPGDNRPITEIFFEDLLQDLTNPGLKARALDFSNPKTAVHGIMEYVNAKRSTVVGGDGQRLGPIELTAATQESFEKNLANLDYGRVFSRNVEKLPANLDFWKFGRYFTDGHNSLIFIKSIRKIANILEKHDIYASESIIQLNRGSKFLEDQVKNTNSRKAEVYKRMALLDKAELTLPNPSGFPSKAPNLLCDSMKAKLAPHNLGSGYAYGMLTKASGDFKQSILSMNPNLAILWDLNKALGLGTLASSVANFFGSIVHKPEVQDLL